MMATRLDDMLRIAAVGASILSPTPPMHIAADTVPLRRARRTTGTAISTCAHEDGANTQPHAA